MASGFSITRLKAKRQGNNSFKFWGGNYFQPRIVCLPNYQSSMRMGEKQFSGFRISK